MLGAGLAGTAAALTGVPATAQLGAPARADPSFPSTRLAREARHLVIRTQQVHLRNHGLRSFLFARAAAEQAGRRPGQDYDVELTFLICVLHDRGLTALANTNQRFEVAGADFTAEFLEQRGVTDDRVDTVWDTIALRTSPTYDMSPVYQRRRAPEIGIAMDGIGIDVLGGPHALPPGYADRVLAVYPRLGATRALTDAIVKHAMSDPRKAPPMTLPCGILHHRHPSLPYQTRETTVDSAGWGD